MNREKFLTASIWAVIIWGVAAAFLLFQFSVYAGSILGAGFALLTGGLTYLFQSVQLHYFGQDKMVPGWVSVLALLPVVTWSLGALAALSGV